MGKKILKNVLTLCVVVIFILGVICLINNSGGSFEKFDSDMEEMEGEKNIGHASVQGVTHPSAEDDDDEDETEEYQNSTPGCVPKDQLSPEELLPQSNSSEWAKVNPDGVGTLKDKNFLQAGYHVGINTVGQTLRNANLQLRSDPPNPQVAISPWLQSTISPDMNRKPMEIGGCA